jgi:hypothetical protein
MVDWLIGRVGAAMTSVHMLLSMDLTEPSAAGLGAAERDGAELGLPGRRAVIAHRDLLVMLQKEVCASSLYGIDQKLKPLCNIRLDRLDRGGCGLHP